MDGQKTFFISSRKSLPILLLHLLLLLLRHSLIGNAKLGREIPQSFSPLCGGPSLLFSSHRRRHCRFCRQVPIAFLFVFLIFVLVILAAEGVCSEIGIYFDSSPFLACLCRENLWGSMGICLCKVVGWSVS